ncbi:hypothetical protein [Rhodococcoides fascians]|uniref:hypothetical protein n=1 Tax=Rhodococcoides fascians TaxID=1828 RepID=UPI001D8A5C70|nr:hypothetical protein [Rhodococcus fascians]CAH0126619.1 hypothetical protein SRABI91_00095 [Rhodococcus fascians]
MTDHFNAIRDGDDAPIAMSAFQAERVAVQLRGISDGTVDRGDAELAARFLYSLALDARPHLREDFAYNLALDSYKTWEAVAFLPLPPPYGDPDFTSRTLVYVVTGRPRFRSRDFHVLICTAINAAMWPPTSTPGVHVAFRLSDHDQPIAPGSVVSIPGRTVTSTITLYAGSGRVGDNAAREVDVLHNLERSVRILESSGDC